MTEPDPLTDRLSDLGRQPVDPATSSRHLSAMAAAGTSPGRRRVSTKLKIGLAFGAGLLIGGTGLASAGALPGPAQNVAHTTLSKVGVNVPQGTERYNDPAVCGLDPATQKPFRNHGQYVKANKGNPAAAESRCGKPVQAGQKPEAPAGQPKDPAAPDANPGKGNGNNGQGKGNNGKGNGNGQNKPPKVKGPEEPKGPAPAPGKSDAPATITPASTTTAAPTTTTTATTTTTTTTPP